MKYADLVRQIKNEARVKDDDTFTSIIVDVLNDLFKEAIESQRPFEFKKETTIPLTAAVTHFDLPVDFFLHHKVIFHDVDTGKEYPLTDEDGAVQPAPRGMYGHPRTFEINTGGQIFIKQIGSIVTGDWLILVYYKKPPEIDPSDLIIDNPLARLEPFLVRAAIQRVRLYHSDDATAMQVLNGMVSSAAKGFSNDEPITTKEKSRA